MGEEKGLAEEATCARMGHHSSSERWLLLLRIIRSALVIGNIKKFTIKNSCWQLIIKRVYQLFAKVHLQPVNRGYNHSLDV